MDELKVILEALKVVKGNISFKNYGIEEIYADIRIPDPYSEIKMSFYFDGSFEDFVSTFQIQLESVRNFNEYHYTKENFETLQCLLNNLCSYKNSTKFVVEL